MLFPNIEMAHWAAGKIRVRRLTLWQTFSGLSLHSGFCAAGGI